MYVSKDLFFLFLFIYDPWCKPPGYCKEQTELGVLDVVQWRRVR